MKNKHLISIAMGLLLLGCTKENIETSPTPNSVALTASAKFLDENANPPYPPDYGVRLLNKNYNDSATACQPGEGLFMCTGVFLRTVDNGNFNPWEPSPSAIALGSSSFTWLRKDISTNTLYHRAGYIRTNPVDAHGGGGGTFNWSGVNCIYPFDASTLGQTRGHNGCDFQNTKSAQANPAPANASPSQGYEPWGSCDKKLGYTTASQWNEFYQSNGMANNTQCSWSGNTASQWLAMLSSHESFAKTGWNEILVPTVSAWEPYFIFGFFYDTNKAGARADAQAFQVKLSALGRRFPIYSINFSAPASQRFSYSAADQVAYP